VEQHEGATSAAVTIVFTEYKAILNVLDNGTGPSVSSALGNFSFSVHLGIISMQECAELIGGSGIKKHTGASTGNI
jgi:signal transduction histidine kinase